MGYDIDRHVRRKIHEPSTSVPTPRKRLCIDWTPAPPLVGSNALDEEDVVACVDMIDRDATAATSDDKAASSTNALDRRSRVSIRLAPRRLRQAPRWPPTPALSTPSRATSEDAVSSECHRTRRGLLKPRAAPACRRARHPQLTRRRRGSVPTRRGPVPNFAALLLRSRSHISLMIMKRRASPLPGTVFLPQERPSVRDQEETPLPGRRRRPSAASRPGSRAGIDVRR